MLYKIKKRWIVLLSFLIIFILVLEKRSFYCLENGKCVTVWKGFSGCFVMPYKYYGLFYPHDNYIKTKKAEETFISVYWNDSLPEKVFFDVPPRNLIHIANDSKEKGAFIYTCMSDEEFSKEIFQNSSTTRIKKEYLDILYDDNPLRVWGVKKNVSFISIDVQYNKLINKTESEK